MKFMGNFASSSDVVLEFNWILSLNLIEDQTKNKKITAIWYYIRPEFGIYLCSQPLFRLIIHTVTRNREGTEIYIRGDAEISMGKC